MSAEPICIACNVERMLISVTPVRNRHEMLNYECPKCRNVFRLVARREPREFAEAVAGRPAFAATGQ
jgi:hypothetical protein